MWDTHMLDLGSGKGRVLLFRHKVGSKALPFSMCREIPHRLRFALVTAPRSAQDFGTAVELHSQSPGFFHYIEVLAADLLPEHASNWTPNPKNKVPVIYSLHLEP